MLLNIEAFDLNDDFIKTIKDDFNVEIVNKDNIYNVIFKGSKNDLIKMYKTHWDYEVDNIDSWLSEE